MSRRHIQPSARTTLNTTPASTAIQSVVPHRHRFRTLTHAHMHEFPCVQSMQNRLLMSDVVDVGSVRRHTGRLLLSRHTTGSKREWFVRHMRAYGLHTTGGCPPGSVTQLDATGKYLSCNPFSTISGCQQVGRFTSSSLMPLHCYMLPFSRTHVNMCN
jgi:hypothetical protein